MSFQEWVILALVAFVCTAISASPPAETRYTPRNATTSDSSPANATLSGESQSNETLNNVSSVNQGKTVIVDTNETAPIDIAAVSTGNGNILVTVEAVPDVTPEPAPVVATTSGWNVATGVNHAFTNSFFTTAAPFYYGSTMGLFGTPSQWDIMMQQYQDMQTTTPFPGNKHGVCPSPEEVKTQCSKRCNRDADCVGEQKCCHDGSGSAEGCCSARYMGFFERFMRFIWSLPPPPEIAEKIQ